MSTQPPHQNETDPWNHHRSRLVRMRDDLLASCRDAYLEPVADSSLAELLNWYANLSKEQDLIYEIETTLSRMDEGMSAASEYVDRPIWEDELAQALHQRPSSPVSELKRKATQDSGAGEPSMIA
jgi:hypothetical protein